MWETIWSDSWVLGGGVVTDSDLGTFLVEFCEEGMSISLGEVLTVAADFDDVIAGDVGEIAEVWVGYGVVVAKVVVS